MTRKLLLDTNILIDLLDARRPQHASAIELVRGTDDLYALASSLKDVYCIACRMNHDESRARMDIRQLMEIVDVLDLTVRHARRAIDSDEPDFEDGLVRAAAEDSGIDCIVSRDATAFQHSPIPSMDASAALGCP